VSINTLAASAVARCCVSTLHHKILDNSVEFVSFVVEIASFLSCTMNTEVFSCLGNNLVKKFHDNTTLLVSLLTFFTDFNIEKNLLIGLVEIRKRVVLRRCALFIIVNTFRKKLLHRSLLRRTFFGLSFFNLLKMSSEIFVFWVKFDCVLNVLHRFIKLGCLKESNTA